MEIFEIDECLGEMVRLTKGDGVILVGFLLKSSRIDRILSLGCDYLISFRNSTSPIFSIGVRSKDIVRIEELEVKKE